MCLPLWWQTLLALLRLSWTGNFRFATRGAVDRQMIAEHQIASSFYASALYALPRDSRHIFIKNPACLHIG